MNELFHSVSILMSLKNLSNKFDFKLSAEYYQPPMKEPITAHKKDDIKQNISRSKVRLNPIPNLGLKHTASNNHLSIIEEASEFKPQFHRPKFHKQSLSPAKLIPTQANNNSKELKDKSKIQSYKDDSKPIELLKSVFFKPKIPKLYNGKHTFEDDINLKSDIPAIFSSLDENKLNHKLEVSFLEGYSEKVIQKCIDLLQSESDIFLLENNFPGVYQEYINYYNPKSSGSQLTPMSASSIISEKLGRLNTGHTNFSNISTQSNLNQIATKNSMRILPLSNSMDVQDNQGLSSYSGRNLQNRGHDFFDITGRISSITSLFGKRFANIPKVTAEQFKSSLMLFKELSSNSKFILFFSPNKYGQVDLGFAEITIHEENLRQCHISKLFISKIYRKMKMTLKIYAKFIEYSFNICNIEKLSLNIMPGNEGQLNDLLNMGFKLEKIILKNNIRYKFLTLKRKEFMDFLTQITQAE